jgi:NAD(P)-dependent dehydrogenase (short-subunit alcohol dehydrogenase family)
MEEREMVKSTGRLDGKVAIVTGGGDGIGKGICQVFAEEGARLAVIDINDETGGATVAELRATGAEAAFFHCDVGIEEEIAAMADAVAKAFGGIDVLINNAGVHLTKGTLETATAEWERCLAVDLRGVWLCTKYCAPAMIARGKGAVVNISSVQGVQTMVNFAAYATAKAGVIGLTRNMALDLAPTIRVNSILPGYIWTPLYDRWLERSGDAENLHKSVVDLQPMKRIGTPRDVAQGCVYLACDESSWVTGTSLTVDGGLTARIHN